MFPREQEGALPGPAARSSPREGGSEPSIFLRYAAASGRCDGHRLISAPDTTEVIACSIAPYGQEFGRPRK